MDKFNYFEANKFNTHLLVYFFRVFQKRLTVTFYSSILSYFYFFFIISMSIFLYYVQKLAILSVGIFITRK